MTALLHSQQQARASQPHRHYGCVTEKAPALPLPDLASTLHIYHTPTNHRREKGSWRDKMPSFRRCLSVMLVIAFFTVVFAATPVAPKPWRFSANVPPNEASFQDLLAAVSDDALHEVLHDVSDKYKHGAYPEDRAAIEAINEDSPALAKRLVELARRQNVTGTTVTKIVTPTTSVVVVVPTTATTVVTAVKPTDTAGSAAPTTPAGSSPLPPPTSNPPATTDTTSPQDTTITQTTTPIVTVTSGAVATSTVDAPPPSGMTTSTTSKLVSTTKEVVFVTTDPQGSPSTVTSYTIVAASDQATPAVANPSVSVTPSLQNGAKVGREPIGVGIAVALFAASIFVGAL